MRSRWGRGTTEEGWEGFSERNLAWGRGLWGVVTKGSCEHLLASGRGTSREGERLRERDFAGDWGLVYESVAKGSVNTALLEIRSAFGGGVTKDSVNASLPGAGGSVQ